MRLVVLESPYAGGTSLNVDYARACMAHSLHLGEAPIASHLLYPQPGILDDTVKEERTLGIEAGFAWGAHAEAAVVYRDLGLSKGMIGGILQATSRDIPVENRRIGFDWAADPGVRWTAQIRYQVSDDTELLTIADRAQNFFRSRWAELDGTARVWDALARVQVDAPDNELLLEVTVLGLRGVLVERLMAMVSERTVRVLAPEFGEFEQLDSSLAGGSRSA